MPPGHKIPSAEPETPARFAGCSSDAAAREHEHCPQEIQRQRRIFWQASAYGNASRDQWEREIEQYVNNTAAGSVPNTPVAKCTAELRLTQAFGTAVKASYLNTGEPADVERVAI
ncbi:LOW QUALITY PROTEIN: hypothetical protein ColTof4_01356 [Colletotrichum tofieldiae]|nr:LOW QUALITY PROTEIN: hypothetical protein ColTof3_08610 [Colletotrichum tofieldiae]GKT68933.1 LOW QUALITY PROTEIN: hypothetical protein ColTof4_01356 [Colletotrichum tofieldiae]